MSEQRKETTVRPDQHLMPWIIAGVHTPTTRDCVLVATMIGNEMQNISLHVLERTRDDAAPQH